jgi:hypothetical protein
VLPALGLSNKPLPSLADAGGGAGPGEMRIAGGAEDGEDGPFDEPPPLSPSRTNWTRLVPPPVLTGHVSSLFPY